MTTFEIEGEALTLPEIMARTGMPKSTIGPRLRRGIRNWEQIKARPLSPAEVARQGAKRSPWGKRPAV